MDFSKIGNGTIVVVGVELVDRYSLQCLAVDKDNLPTERLANGSTCWVVDTQEAMTLHQGVWY